MKVLSLFDGMACGMVALKKSGIPVEGYWASEIDSYAIRIAKKNHPEIKHLGDITKWEEWDFPVGYFDLIMGGSPCQGFSLAGRQLNFMDPRSRLYFEYEKIIKHFKPRFWLLENVKMKKQYQDIITDRLGAQPVLINSALVSAQNRERLYWANFEIVQPQNREILLADIVLPNTWPNLSALMLSPKEREYMDREVEGGRTHWDFKHHSDVRAPKSAAVVANFHKGVPYNVLKDWHYIRKFHPIECERLQTLPDGYTEGVSHTQRYKMIGNGWTVDVIAHIFNCMAKATAEGQVA
jgi:site-specific DNA-cytosine methylase